MDLGRTCTWFMRWILNLKLQSFQFHVPLGNSVHLSSSCSNSHTIQSPGLCERATGNIWKDKGTVPATDLIQSGFYKGSLPQLTTEKYIFWYFNGLILNKRMEKWVKFLWELNWCFSGRIPENQLKRSPQSLLHIVDLNPSRFLLVLYCRFSLAWREDLCLLHFK